MKRGISIFIFCFQIVFQSCISHQRKSESLKNTLLAEDLIKNSLSYTDSLNDTNRKDFEKALRYIDKAIALDSSNVRAYEDKQTIYTNLGKEVDTLTLFKILELKPNFAEEYVILGGVYERLKRIQSAKEAYKKAKIIYLSRPPSDGRNLNLIVTEFRITNDKSEALEKLKQFPIQNPNLKRDVMVSIDDIEKGRSER
ncbi:MAG TPA: hypothetical protein VIJ92_00455 [Ginsengibacter sp.]